jgi:hypothetical protein
VAELEDGAVVCRQQPQKLLKPAQVLLRERRQLEQHQPALVAERSQVPVQVAQWFSGRVGGRARTMRDPFRRLDREAERRRRDLGPMRQSIRVPACGCLPSGDYLMANGAGMPRWNSRKLPVATVG